MKPTITPNNIAKKTQSWLKKVAPYNTHTMQIQREVCALMIVDMQQFFLEPSSPTFTIGGPVILPERAAPVKRLPPGEPPGDLHPPCASP